MADRVRSVNIAFSPAELAAFMANQPGFVFLDSSLASGEAISILGADPREILTGGIEDFPLLRDRLARQSIDVGDCGLPVGAMIGWVAFDGQFRFGVYGDLLVYIHRTGEWRAVGNPNIPQVQRVRGSHKAPHFSPEISRDRFCSMVQRAKDYIAAGDIYQVCLAHRFSSPFSGEPWPFYESLRHYSPAPYAAYLSLGDTTVLSASPENFLEISGRTVSTRPIKGTRPRRADADADERSAYELITSPKEIAELVMITDLERNDLGRICEYGSVHVADLLRLERYEQVFHLVSTVRGTLRPEVSHADALAACFPGGSISGAPKKRALEIIAELEPAPRGIYTGAIGYFGFNGESRFNIAIRTVVIENGIASFHTGAGIVADSIPGMEWQETLDKASGILLAAARMNASEPSRPAPRGALQD